MSRETVQEERTREILEAEGVLYRKDGRQGWPDRCAFVGLRVHIWVEHKTERGRMTPAQKRVFPKLEAIGDVIIYAKGMTPDEIAAEVFKYTILGRAARLL